MPALFSQDEQATSASSVEPNKDKAETISNAEETGEENSTALAENIITRVFINIFNAIKTSILKIFSFFT